MSQGVRCPKHPDSPKIVKAGRRAGGRRQRYRCYPTFEHFHDFLEPVVIDLVGSCTTCQRDWAGGFAAARRSRFVVPVIADFLRNMGRGDSLRLAAERTRTDAAALTSERAKKTGHGAPPHRGLSEDGRSSVDWLDRYGYLVTRDLMAQQWPSATIVVDSQPFRAKSYYPKKHPLAGRPKPNGVPAFAVLAAGIRLPSGSKRRRHDLKILHVRAFPADDKPQWVAFFRSLPGTPATIISDPDPQIAYAIREAWPPGSRPRHVLSTWHYRNKVQEKFVASGWYPTTHPLAADALDSFADPHKFAVFRVRAMLWGPPKVKTWLRIKGDEVQARLETAAATSTSDVDAFLKGRVWRALNIGRGRISNLSRLDVRLALLALNWNRQDRKDRYEEILVEHLSTEVRTPRSKRRQLDGEFYDEAWLLAG